MGIEALFCGSSWKRGLIGTENHEASHARQLAVPFHRMFETCHADLVKTEVR